MIDYRKYDTVYADAEEKYMKAVVLYSKASDNYVYKKATAAEGDKIDKDTLLELCKKGVLVLLDGVYYVPSQFADKTTHTTLTIGASTVLNSKEYSEE